MLPSLMPTMIYITEIQMGKDGSSHEHIEAVRWELQSSPTTWGESTVEEMIDWIDNKKGFVHVRDSQGNDVRVETRHPGPPKRSHIRTQSDDAETDNLLSLPRYGVDPKRIKPA
jgi:hypothetical protein